MKTISLSEPLAAVSVARIQTLRDWLALKRDEVEKDLDMEAWTCGSTMCAVGWGLECPALQEQGMRWDKGRTYPVYMHGMDPLLGRPEELCNWDAVEAFYFSPAGREWNDDDVICMTDENGDYKVISDYLFGDGYPDGMGLDDVLERIDEVLAASARSKHLDEQGEQP